MSAAQARELPTLAIRFESQGPDLQKSVETGDIRGGILS